MPNGRDSGARQPSNIPILWLPRSHEFLEWAQGPQLRLVNGPACRDSKANGVTIPHGQGNVGVYAKDDGSGAVRSGGGQWGFETESMGTAPNLLRLFGPNPPVRHPSALLRCPYPPHPTPPSLSPCGTSSFTWPVLHAPSVRQSSSQSYSVTQSVISVTCHGGVHM